ncbi:plasmid segregation actin-type ATPase ParM [Janthinobacterium sp. TND4EL3]|jgi:plasmid segregation protein ParM|uniref:ParM/StbA family protein n=1 Tax=Janthinobacterium sp. TND4EL3 TaxID=1907311 RepID=UPI000955A034|nr:ParM/StbA family protein [Janthinobacterium sp. TND4EL3]SIR80288.1 plasmid segregation actin-type ATPase ParM [Janthinobacterium sp. TND4EL3]
MSINSQTETLMIVGVDDGHDTIKSCWGWDKETGSFKYGYHKARAVEGLQQVMSVGSHSSTGGAYETEGQRFTVAGSQNLLRTLDTRIDGYPISDLNRTLVCHSLAACGLGDTPVLLITGLPVDQYYKNGAPNHALIGKKIESLAKPVTRIGKGPGLARILKQSVISEAIAAFYDVLIRPDGTFDADIESLISRRPVGVVDLGGKTLDIVVVAENVSSVYNDRSGTSNIGVLHLLDKVADRIKSEYDLNSNPPLPFVEQACRTKKYELFGEIVDVSHIIEEACKDYLTLVKNYFVTKAGDGSDLGAVLFVGGGTALILSALGADAFASIYKGKRIIVSEPEYANARGMWKYGTFVLNASERTMSTPVKAA